MNWAELIENLPAAGWFVLILLVSFVGVALVMVFMLVRNKNIKLKGFELKDVEAKAVKEQLAHKEGKNILGSQEAVAHNLLKKMRTDLYRAGLEAFELNGDLEHFLFKDICHLIEDKLNYEVRSDLIRNHITDKSDLELQKYSDAKATGYYQSVTASLYDYNVQLPGRDLPSILKSITLDDFKRTFGEIYFSARKIAGGQND